MSDLCEEVRLLKELLHRDPYVRNTCSNVTAPDPIAVDVAVDVDNQPPGTSFANKAHVLYRVMLVRSQM